MLAIPAAAVHPNGLEHAVLIVSGLRRAAQIEIEIVAHKQVELAVPVVVDPRAASAPAGPVQAYPGRLRDVAESAVSVIVVQGVLAPVGDEQVFVPVVVVIADRNTRRPARAHEPRPLSHIRECAVSIVVIQAVRGTPRSFPEACPAKQQNVQPTVVIVIEKRAPAAHRLDDVVLVAYAAVNRGCREAGPFRDVRKPSQKRDAGGFTARRGLHVSRGHPLRPQRRRAEQQRAATE